MIICQKCKTENTADSIHCKICGSKLDINKTDAENKYILIHPETISSVDEPATQTDEKDLVLSEMNKSKGSIKKIIITITTIVLALIIGAVVIWNTNSSVEDTTNYEQTTTAMTPYEKAQTEKYKKCLENEDFASALIFSTCDFVHSSPNDIDLIHNSITERCPVLYYRFLANKNQFAVFPYAMRGKSHYSSVLPYQENALLNSFSFDEKYRMIPSCVEFTDGQYGFAVYVDDSSINNLYIDEDDSQNYDTHIYNRSKTASYMYDSTQNFGGYVSDGIINMIYEYVLNDKAISFKTDTDELIILTDEESQIWVETYALTYMCNKDSSIFKEKIALSVY